MNASFIIRRNNGIESNIPVSHFFRGLSGFSPIELAAVELCKVRVLDVGAGTGSLSKVLQNKDYRVSALDISPEAVAPAKQRNQRIVVCQDIFAFEEGNYNKITEMKGWDFETILHEKSGEI